MPTPERLIELETELKSLNLELAKYDSTLKSMPKGCSCNAVGRARNEAINKYKRDVINPLKDKISILLTEKRTP
jgi:hypothetical protein